MKNITKTMLVVVMLCLITSNLNCAHSLLHSPPRLELRKLEISLDSPSLYYQYEVCVKSFLGRCTRWGSKRDVYDLTNETVRKELKDKGFVLQVREKPIQ